MRNKTNHKYTSLAIVILLLGVTIALAGFSDIILVILASDVGILLAVLTFEQRTRAIMTRKESKALIKLESPLNWLKACALLSVVSILASLAYEIMNDLDIKTDAPIIGNSSLLFFAIAFFVMALIYILRITVFMIDPASRTNIFAGKLIYKVLDIGMRVTQLSFIVCVQILNGLLLYETIQIPASQRIFSEQFTILYASTIVLSFIGTIPLAIAVVLRPHQHIKRRGWVAVAFFLSPWVVLAIVAILLKIGIKLV